MNPAGIRILEAVLLAALSLWLAAPPAGAHSGIHRRIEHATETIERQPKAARGYISRAYLHTEHQDWAAALDDIRQAERLAGNPALTDFPHARVLWQQYRETGQKEALDKALLYINRHVQASPSDARGRLLRARIFQARGKAQQALQDYEAALAHTDRPQTDLFLETARLWQQQGHPDRALAVLEDCLKRTGTAPVPVSRLALEIAMKNHQPKVALEWWERLPPVLRQLPDELLTRGDLLAHTGNGQAAREAWCEAKRRYEQMPSWRRQKPNLKTFPRQLESRLQQSCKPS
ncbi:tetratricopeptide repeat protein [Thiolapillus sp.]